MQNMLSVESIIEPLAGLVWGIARFFNAKHTTEETTALYAIAAPPTIFIAECEPSIIYPPKERMAMAINWKNVICIMGQSFLRYESIMAFTATHKPLIMAKLSPMFIVKLLLRLIKPTPAIVINAAIMVCICGVFFLIAQLIRGTATTVTDKRKATFDGCDLLTARSSKA